MAGNSHRRGATRKDGTKKGMVVGSGGQRRRALEGRGPTPPAEMRKGHPAQRRAAAAAKHAAKGGDRGRPAPARRRHDDDAPETVLGRNPVVECLRAGVPATALHVALGTTADERIAEAVQLAADAGIAILEVPRNDLDRIAGGALHQGVALQVPPYEYAHPDDLLEVAADGADPALIVALDGVTDPRNLGAVVRSVSAFGGHGVVVPQRRVGEHDGRGVADVGGHRGAAAGGAGDEPDPHPARVRHRRADDRRAGRRGLGVARRVRPGGGPAGAGGRLGGQGPVPAGPPDLRRHGVDPDGRARWSRSTPRWPRGSCWRRSPAAAARPAVRRACMHARRRYPRRGRGATIRHAT